MWQRLVSLVRALRTDIRGAIAVQFALTAMLMTTAVGVGIDTYRLFTVQAAVCRALDAAGLAAGTVYRDAAASPESIEAALEGKFQGFFRENYPYLVASGERVPFLGTLESELDLQILSGDNERYLAYARVTLDPAFLSLVGISDIPVDCEIEVTRENLGMEVVLVLDVTGSMAGSSGSSCGTRLECLRSASGILIDELFPDDDSTPELLRVGIVPYASAVNVGANAWQIVPTFRVDHPFTLPQHRWVNDLYAMMATYYGSDDPRDWQKPICALDDQVCWRGCVMARDPDMDIADTGATSSDRFSAYGDNSHNFWIPYWWPNEDRQMTVPAALGGGTNTNTDWRCRPGTTYDAAWVDNENEQWSNAVASMVTRNAAFVNNMTDPDGAGALLPGQGVPTWICSHGGIRTSSNANTDEGPPNNWSSVAGTSGTSSVESYWYEEGNNIRGPNRGCPVDPIIPLTNDRAVLDTAVTGLSRSHRGGTFANVGLAWGWRVISPGAPYTDGAAYGDPDWQKVIVMMTDGDNQFYQGTPSDFTAMGRDTMVGGVLRGYWSDNPTNDTVDQRLDARFATLCDNVKDEGITIMTITFSNSVSNRVQDLYRDCATYPRYYWHAPNGAALQSIFGEVGKVLSNLRLSK